MRQNRLSLIYMIGKHNMKDDILEAMLMLPVLSGVLFVAFLCALWDGRWGGRE